MGKKKMTSIGGQAVIEGVMMRGPHKIAVAVRKSDGDIVIDEQDVKSKGFWGKIPLVRGVIAFFSSMIIGVKALTFSAKFFEDEEEKEKNVKQQRSNKDVENANINSENVNSRDEQVANEKSETNVETRENEIATNKNGSDTKQINKNVVSSSEVEKPDSAMPDWAIYVSVLVSLLISVGLFIVLPNVVSNFVVPNKEENVILYNFVESIVKIAIFLGYLFAVSQMKDMRRVFEYHGAEHKSIFCYENGEELTVENVKKYSRFHPRCGTSFLLFVIIISIIVFSIIGLHKNPFINIGLRLLFLPLVAGISYEIIKFAGRSKSKWITWLNEPGKWLQRLTTREPDDSQIEVAIASLKAVIPENEEDDLW